MRIIYLRPHRICLEAENQRERELLEKLEPLLPAMLDEAAGLIARQEQVEQEGDE